MKYLLDTNVCIYILRGKYDLIDKVEECGEDNCFISELTVAELKYGEELGRQKGAGYRKQALQELLNTFRIIPIYESLDMYAKEKARLRLAGTPIGDDFDLIIGCTAVVKGMTLATENVKDFQKIKGIKIENWIKR